MGNTEFEEVERMPDGLQFFTYEEAARILKVQRGTVRTWVCRGAIRSTIKMGKKSLIPKSELQRFVAERTRIKDKNIPVRKISPVVATPQAVETPPGE
jgi:excisionase family DNA binding protein